LKKRLAAAAAFACAAAVGAGTAAQAGPEATDQNGNYVVFDAEFRPPVSSTRRTASAIDVYFNAAFGNKQTGRPFPSGPDVTVTMPRGTVYNGTRLPQCPQASAPAEVGQESRCRSIQRVGEGDTIIDARALGVESPIFAKLAAYNGAPRNGRPTLIIFATGQGAAQGVNAEIVFEWNGRQLVLSPQPGMQRVPYSFSSFDLRTGKTRTIRRGKRRTRVTLWEAPERCSRSRWNFSLKTSRADVGLDITANDTSPCLQLRD
jgi:hypothetical protein